MKNCSRHHGKLEILRREPTSANGNPRYFAYCAGVNFYTAPDSPYGYSLPNYNGKEVTVVIGTYHGRPTLDYIEPLNVAR